MYMERLVHFTSCNVHVGEIWCVVLWSSTFGSEDGKNDEYLRAFSRYLHTVYLLNMKTLTPSTPAVSNCCCSKGPVPDWFNPSFLIFDIRALWGDQPARVCECQKLKMVG